MPVDVEEGRKYFWCSCGKSNRQPFCDGSHEGTDFLPMSYTAEKTRTLYFCACNTPRARHFATAVITHWIDTVLAKFFSSEQRTHSGTLNSQPE